MFRNTQALKYILVSKNTDLRLIGQDIVQLWKMTVWQLSLHPGRTVIAFAISQLKEFKSRDDYRELLELTTMFFGGISSRGIHFRYPGAVHCARWTARAIYSIKMVLFRSQCNFRSSRKCSEEDHQPLMSKQFGIT